MSLVLVMGGDVNGVMLCGKRWRHCGGWQATLPSNRIAAASCHRCGDLACFNMAPSWRRPATGLKDRLSLARRAVRRPEMEDFVDHFTSLAAPFHGQAGNAVRRQPRRNVDHRGAWRCRLCRADVVGQGSLGRDMHVMTKPFELDRLGRRIRELIEGIA